MTRELEPSELKRFPLFSEFSAEEREALFEMLEPSVVRAGRSIYRETSEADGLVLIVSGRVTLSSTRREGSGELGSGEVLGVTSVLSNGRRAATAKAETECQLLSLPRTSYRRLLEDYPRVGCRLTEAIAAHLATVLRDSLEALQPLPE